MKTKMCIGVKVFERKDKKGKRKYSSIEDYIKEYGLNGDEKYFMKFKIKDLITGDITETDEMIISYNKKIKKFINETKYVQVTYQTVINKCNYTKLAGLGNEPKLRLTYNK